MFKHTKYIVIPVLIFLITSCIDVQYKVSLNNDGSGTIEEKVLMSKQVVAMLGSFMQMGDSTKQEKFSLFKEDELKEEATKIGEGVQYVEGKELNEDGKEGYIAYYKFDDINKIKLDQDPSDKIPSTGMESQGNDQDEDIYTFLFTKGNPSKLIINLPKEKNKADTNKIEQETESGETDTSGTDMFGSQMMELFKDFRIAVNLSVEGEIINTNAKYVEGNTITLLDMDFGQLFKMPEKLKELKKLKPNSLEETSELLKDIPGFKVDLQEKIEVEFK